MKKAIVFRALLTAGVLICSSQVMAQGIEIADKNSKWAFSFEQLKEWIFAPRSTSTSLSKSLPPPSELPLSTDPALPCSTDPVMVIYGRTICDAPPVPPVPPRPINPNERPKPGTCIGCGES